jgi:hypothetical protein
MTATRSTLTLVPAPKPVAARECSATVTDLQSWAKDHDYDEVASSMEFNARMERVQRLLQSLFPALESSQL